MEYVHPDATSAHETAAGSVTDVLGDDHGDDGDHHRHDSPEDGHDQGGDAAPAQGDPSTARRSVDDIERLLDGVEAALGRLDEGTYGVCTSCGSPITDERMTASPTATRCAACDPTDREG